MLITCALWYVAYGVLDTGYRPDLTVEEAIDLGKRAIYHATHRDAASGGINNLFHVTKEGWVQIHAIDVTILLLACSAACFLLRFFLTCLSLHVQVNEMHYEYVAEKANAMAT